MQHVEYRLGMTLDELEKAAILFAYHHYKTKTATAQSLGIAIRTLDNKLERYEVDGTRARTVDEQRLQDNKDFLKRCRGELPAKVPQLQRDASASLKAVTGVDIKSAANASAQQSLPLQERQEVQVVPPPKASSTGNGRRRDSV